MKIRREVRTATVWGIVVTALLGAMVILGSRNLTHFDAALVAYTFATLFAAFGITYRYTMWLQRPPTAMYWRRGWRFFLQRKQLVGNVGRLVQRAGTDVAANRFIWRRGRLRWLAHWLIMWGCIAAFGITFPLVFGWLHFTTLPNQTGWYQVYLFGFGLFRFPLNSIFSVIIFHGLVWSSFLVIGGVMLAMWRRMRDQGAAAVQQFIEDLLPLILLFAISVTGLMLTASYTWMRGYAFDFIAILHAITVIFTLLYMPFGKFFHIFQRPAQLGASFYKDAGARGATAACRRCGDPFSSQIHVEDLIKVEQQLGYDYRVDGPIEHYQWICPPCRRALVALAQSKLWQGELGAQIIPIFEGEAPTPQFGNRAISEGPLGSEDRANLHF